MGGSRGGVTALRLPRSVTVGGTRYRVLRPKKILHGGVECYGLTDLEDCTISIVAGLSEEKAYKTYQHELFHCAWEAAQADHVVGLLDCRDIKQRGFAEEFLAGTVAPIYCAALDASKRER